MTFVSYAQNFEDVMLWRALKHVEKGFYIDIGAQHPINDSVSKAFYDRGWRGIHVEPTPEYVAMLRKNRPDETVLDIAISDRDGSMEFYVVPETGLSTGVDAFVQNVQAISDIIPQKIQVKTLTMRSAFESLKGKDVHWLKIDVEGFEEKVLQGWDSQSLRPWIIVVEATIPNSKKLNYAVWESIILSSYYKFVYFDGLNRYYVSKEHDELAEAFSSPPNCFDNFEISSTSVMCRSIVEQLQETQSQLQETQSQLQETQLQLQETQTQLLETQSQLRGAFIGYADLESRFEKLRSDARILLSRRWLIILEKTKFSSVASGLRKELWSDIEKNS